MVFLLKSIRKFFLWNWHNPVMMTWLWQVSKIGNVFFLLPFLLNKFPVEIINLWFLFQVVFSLKDTLDLGVVNNISRSYSYAYGGAVSLEDVAGNAKEGVNLLLLSKINVVSKKVYLMISVLSFLILSILGSLAVFRPVMEAGGTIDLWFSWGVIVLFASVSLWGNRFSSALIGVNNVALMRRTDALLGLLFLFFSILIVVLGGSFIWIVVIYYSHYVGVVVKNYLLWNKISAKLSVYQVPFDSSIWANIKSRAIRSFLGGLGRFGSNQGLSIIVSNFFPVSVSASYLFANRIVSQLNQIANSPFGAKIPEFSILSVRRQFIELFNNVRKSMFLSYAIVFIGFFIMFFFSEWILELIDSKTPFVSRTIWLFMILALFLERMSAMQLQLFVILTNRVITHYVVPITGGISILLFFLFYPYLDLIAVPFSIIFGYLLFESWYVLYISYKNNGLRFFSLELYTFIPFVFLVLLSLFI